MATSSANRFNRNPRRTGRAMDSSLDGGTSPTMSNDLQSLRTAFDTRYWAIRDGNGKMKIGRRDYKPLTVEESKWIHELGIVVNDQGRVTARSTDSSHSIIIQDYPLTLAPTDLVSPDTRNYLQIVQDARTAAKSDAETSSTLLGMPKKVVIGIGAVLAVLLVIGGVFLVKRL